MQVNVLNYDRNGLPRIELVNKKKPEYSAYFWSFCAFALVVVWLLV